MKKLIYIFALSLAVFSCERGPGNEPEEKIYILDQVLESVATPNDDGTYHLGLSLKGHGFYVSISLDNSEAVIPDGTYKMAKDSTASGTCRMTLNDGSAYKTVTSGEVSVASDNGTYNLNIDITVNGTIGYDFAYEGSLDFDIDLTPSGNALIVTKGDVLAYGVPLKGMTRYTITVLDQAENAIAGLEIVGKAGKKLSELTGDYTVTSSATSAGTMVAGVAGWDSGSGSFYTDDKNTRKYITGGNVRITVIKDNAGTDYFSIYGKGLTTSTSADDSLKLEYIIEDPAHGEIIRNSSISSTAMGRSMRYSTYLPADYETGSSFPILYLLHGYGDDNNAWIDKGNLLTTAYSHEKDGGRQMIVVCPDGLTDFYIGRFETYMYEELMPHIESTYKFNGKRAVAGLSMGGYGTLYYWSKYPGMYSYAYAMSPAVDVSGTSQILTDENKEILPSLTIETGIQDYTTPLAGITDFHDYLVSEGIDHEFITRNGSHDWTFWKECLPKVLNKCGETFK